MASFTLCWLFLQLGKIPPLHFMTVGMTCRGGGFIHPHGLYSLRCHGDESSPLHCVVPFNHTGYIRNVAGGRLPPLILPQRKTPTGRFKKLFLWGCCLFGPDAPGVDLGDFRLFVQEDQVRVFAGGDGALGFPEAHFPGGVFRQGGEDLFQG